jgi:hypothetical protein
MSANRVMSIRWPLVVVCYLAGLIPTLVAAMFWPLNRLVLSLFLAYVAVFFLFACVVIASCYAMLAVAVYRRLYQSLGRASQTKPSGRIPEGVASAVWDRWLDG